MESMCERKILLNQWLEEKCQLSDFSLTPLAGDASFRRYFRLVLPKHKTLIVMDAPPPQENCQPFIAIAGAIRELGLSAPEVIRADLAHGFLLLSDFGDATYLKTLTSQNADSLYSIALDALARLQTVRHVPDRSLPFFNREFMQQEWGWHKEWFIEKLLGLTASKEIDQCYEFLVTEIVAQPQVFMHRDYHSANLMVLPEQKVGILDFQDAFIGPITYDVASLLRDCYIDWPKQKVEQWVRYYWQQLQHANAISEIITFEQFMRWFDLMSVQRHLKALLTFARKKVRDQDARYLTYIPRTLNYLNETTAQYIELAALHHFLQHQVQPQLQRVLTPCAQ